MSQPAGEQSGSILRCPK